MHPQTLGDALHRPGLAEVDPQQLEQLGLIGDAPEASAGEGLGPLLVQEVRDRGQSRGLPAHRLSELPSSGADGQRLLCAPRQISDADRTADADPHPLRPGRDTAVLKKGGNALDLTEDHQAGPAPVGAPQKQLPHRSPPTLDEQAGQHCGEPGNVSTATLEADNPPLMTTTGSGHRSPLRRRQACEDELLNLVRQRQPLRDVTRQEMPGGGPHELEEPSGEGLGGLGDEIQKRPGEIDPQGLSARERLALNGRQVALGLAGDADRADDQPHVAEADRPGSSHPSRTDPVDALGDLVVDSRRLRPEGTDHGASRGIPQGHLAPEDRGQGAHDRALVVLGGCTRQLLQDQGLLVSRPLGTDLRLGGLKHGPDLAADGGEGDLEGDLDEIETPGPAGLAQVLGHGVEGDAGPQSESRDSRLDQ